MQDTPRIVVVGSINMDLVTTTETIPKKGETLIGEKFQMNPGGKGANQAVAAARLGVPVHMIGCVGDDSFGKDLVQHLIENGVNTSNVEPVTYITGTATIIVSNQDNRIIVTPGANNYVTADFVEKNREVIANSDILILQLEVPLEAVQKAAKIAKENDVLVILNPAPIRELPDSLIELVDYITPNEHEVQLLLKNRNIDEIKNKLILTQGSRGVVFYKNEKEVHLPAHSIKVVDTTGAGDSFNGGLAAALSKGLSIEEACRFGNAVAALSTTKMGAQTGMPTEAEVNQFLKSLEQ
ncbi:ribokinase [Lederbergia wuyishanensis]|uniref:Ribokinase n=1 Tax=Lederbergia wuyishanensis TaxID=1347903 RepID=A0ABU0D664_9BACI|nr:ribokinase [Lederbergia wuyishanensis]MCJ8008683.1 ribokinase [Lederbergia wuyishanensis]MDQ0343898.1 ribokinase [Lederbergia wuyishanensis]